VTKREMQKDAVLKIPRPSQVDGLRAYTAEDGFRKPPLTLAVMQSTQLGGSRGNEELFHISVHGEFSLRALKPNKDLINV